MLEEKNIFIIGSKGIPAQYGGFETFVENLTLKRENEKGEAILENVLPGTYYVKEIQAPTGYILYNGYIEIKPKFNEELTITIKNTKEEVPNIEITENKLEVKNTIKKLPKTGM